MNRPVAEPQHQAPRGRWALVVVDMQNDFLHSNGYYARRAGSRDGGDGLRDATVAPVISNVRLAVAAAREAGKPIAFVRAVYDRAFTTIPPSLLRNPNREDHPCSPGSWGAELMAPVAELAMETPPGVVEQIIDKHTYNAFHETSLHDLLRGASVDSVVLCGTETQVCVLSSAQHAAFLGYHPYILEDAVWSANAAAAAAALDIFRDAYGETLRVAALTC